MSPLEGLLVLVHSPLVGPITWAPVAQELRRREVTAVAPILDDAEGAGPHWQQHADAVERALRVVPRERPLLLVGHSGAGPLLPAIRERTGRRAAGYVFVDAGIPEDGASRLELIEAQSPLAAAELRRLLAEGRRFPEWADEDLREAVPDAARRRRLLAELRPRGPAFWEEPIPVFAGWPDAPCGYLLFSPTYAPEARRAQARGWCCAELAAGHFHMLVDPTSVTEGLLGLARDLSGQTA